MIAEVIVDIATSETDRIFDYQCDDSVIVGSRVRAPFGNKILPGFVMRIKQDSDIPSEKLKKVTPCGDELPALTNECLALAEKLTARYRVPKALVLRLFLPTEMRTGKIRELMRNYAQLIREPSDKELARSKNQTQAVEYLREKGKTECAELNKLFPSALTALEKKGLVQITREQILRDPYKTVTGEKVDRKLTDDQLRAVQTVQTDSRVVQLIHGVTGSGKTEIYLTLIAKCLEQGKSSIFLVPEISLTPQMLAQLRSRFGKNAAILHSGLSAGERFDEWWRFENCNRRA